MKFPEAPYPEPRIPAPTTIPVTAQIILQAANDVAQNGTPASIALNALGLDAASVRAIQIQAVKQGAEPFWRWVQATLEQARALGVQRNVKTIQSAADAGDWKAAQTQLQHMAPEFFAPKTTHEHLHQHQHHHNQLEEVLTLLAQRTPQDLRKLAYDDAPLNVLEGEVVAAGPSDAPPQENLLAIHHYGDPHHVAHPPIPQRARWSDDVAANLLPGTPPNAAPPPEDAGKPPVYHMDRPTKKAQKGAPE